MKKLILFLVFAVAAFAQRGGAQPQHSAPAQQQQHMQGPMQQGPSMQHSQPSMQQQQQHQPAQQGWNRFGQPGPGYGRPMPGPGFRPMPVRPIRPPVVIVRPGYGGYYGGYGWNYYFDMGFWPYYYPSYYYGPGFVGQPHQAQPCKKETLKDSTGQKHQVLVCVQPDGSMKVIADADMIAVPKGEVQK